MSKNNHFRVLETNQRHINNGEAFLPENLRLLGPNGPGTLSAMHAECNHWPGLGGDKLVHTSPVPRNSVLKRKTRALSRELTLSRRQRSPFFSQQKTLQCAMESPLPDTPTQLTGSGRQHRGPWASSSRADLFSCMCVNVRVCT